MIMEDPAFYFFDDERHLVERIDAKKATWMEDSWKLEEGIIQKLRDDKSFGFEKFNESDFPINYCKTKASQLVQSMY